MIERLQIESGRNEVSFRIRRSANARVTVVFIHGFPFHSAMWLSQLEALPDDVQGIAYDIRGFGNSSTDHHFYSTDLFARDLLDLISALQLDKVVLCGISMGGYVALRAAEIASEKVSGLILCDTNAGADSNEAKLRRFASIDQVLYSGTEAFADDFMGKLFSEKTCSSNPALCDFIREMIVHAPVPVICATQLALASRTDTLSLLPLIDVPVLVIRGRADKLTTPEQASILSSRIRQAEAEEIADTGHLPNCEAPADFNRVMNRYLSKHFLS